MSKPDQEEAERLHSRLLQGDPVAPADLAEAFLEQIVRRLRIRVFVKDETLIVDAATDALLAYVREPAKFDHTRSDLLRYLTMSARGDLLNQLAKEQRRMRHQVSLDDVEHRLVVGNSDTEEEQDVLERHGIATREARVEILRRVAEAFPDPDDRRVLDLMLRGVRRTTSYSEVLAIQDKPPEEQRRIVKRHKDRITKRLQRIGSRSS